MTKEKKCFTCFVKSLNNKSAFIAMSTSKKRLKNPLTSDLQFETLDNTHGN